MGTLRHGGDVRHGSKDDFGCSFDPNDHCRILATVQEDTPIFSSVRSKSMQSCEILSSSTPHV
jgi:hypothetical protein